MLNNFKYSMSSTLLCAALFSMLILSCCRDPIENPYRWEIERWENVYIDPYYENGYYYVFSEDWDTHQSFLTKIKEIDGKVEYSIPFKIGVDLDLRTSSSTFSEDGRLMLVEGKFIHQFNKSSGQLIATDTFTNFIWNFYWEEEHLSACSFTDGLKSFKYFEIVYKNGHYKERKIHEEFYDHMNNTQVNGGTPPVYANGKWIMTYYTAIRNTNECKNYLITEYKGSVRIETVGYDNNKGFGLAGPLVVDDQTMYVYCVDKLFAFDRNTQSVKWSTDIIGPGLIKIIGDHIYVASSLSIEKMAIVNKHTGDVEIIDNRSAWSGQTIGDYLCWTQGDFYKFNTKTRKLEKGPLESEAKINGYWEYSIGVSPNSKLVFDLKSWECFPF
jgi:outer membrane protein assembly factor BamB